MDEDLKKRLIGAAVLISLAVIFLPMLIEHEPIQLERAYMQEIPVEPAGKFDKELLPQEPAAEKVEGPQVSESPVPPVVDSAEPDTPKSEPEPEVETKPAEPQETAQQQVQPDKQIPSKEPPSGWVVQAGSYSNRQNAEALVTKLRESGLDTMDVQPIRVNDKTLYRVRVGPEIDHNNAKALAPKVAMISGSKVTVVRYPDSQASNSGKSGNQSRKQPVSERAQKETSTVKAPDKTETPESKKAVVNAQAASTPVSSGWVIQAGSYSSRSNAEKVAAKLRNAGLKVLNVETVQVNGKTLYRVRVGPESERKRAESLAPRVARISGAPAKVLKYP